MSAPLALLVPVPALVFKAVAGTFAPLEGALSLSFSSVRFPDGTAMSTDDFMGAQALLSRRSTPTAMTEIWDAAARSWRAVTGVELEQLSGVPLLPPKSATDPWQGLFIGVGQTDAAGAPLIQPATAHFPQYRWRGAFRARRGGLDAVGLGPESASVEFASGAAAARFCADLTPDAGGATRVRITLRNATAQPVGFLEIDAEAGDAMLTLANFTGSGSPLASITLQADGAIRLTPSVGKQLIIAGDLEAEQIRYLPAGGSLKKDLD